MGGSDGGGGEVLGGSDGGGGGVFGGSDNGGGGEGFGGVVVGGLGGGGWNWVGETVLQVVEMQAFEVVVVMRPETEEVAVELKK